VLAVAKRRAQRLSMRFLIPLVLLLAACNPAPPAVTGWLGSDVHLVDGRWIGTESPCATGTDGLECRTIVDRALTLLPDLRTRTTRAVLATLPTIYVTATGERRSARLGVGIMERRVVVADLTDGRRLVIGLLCHVTSQGNESGGATRDVDLCWIDALDDWRDGNAPASLPPGAHFG
jgi:hypothetical protein